jgi:hypothetical protein
MSSSSQQRTFPGWRWIAVAAAFPVAGYIGGAISGPVDAVGAALIGGGLTGAGLGAVQWWSAKGALGRPAAWITASAAGYAGGLAAGSAIVGYETNIGALAVMGLVGGTGLGGAQAVTLAQHEDTRLAVARGAATPLLFALGWCATSAIGVSVEDQFTVFGAAGAVLVMALSGLVLSRFAPTRAQVA